jgi:hypothetical protein
MDIFTIKSIIIFPSITSSIITITCGSCYDFCNLVRKVQQP